MDNGHKPGEVMTDRRGVNRDELSDHERILLLEGKVDKVYNFFGVIKDAIGHIWNALKEFRGAGGKNEN
jgi:hypothetical protein